MSPESDEIRELPSFAFPKQTRREVAIANLEKARASPRSHAYRQKMRENNARRKRYLTREEIEEVFNEELTTEGYVREMARIMKRQGREGSQQSKYRAMLDWRDQIMGKPKLSKDDAELAPPTIVIRSPIFNAIAEAAKKEEDGAD